jgi:hypothetical protein
LKACVKLLTDFEGALTHLTDVVSAVLEEVLGHGLDGEGEACRLVEGFLQ